jgi:signal peptidase I
MARWIWIILIGFIAALIVFLAGFSLVKTKDQSMLPSYPRGKTLLIRHVKPENINRGDVIAYHSPEVSDVKIKNKPVYISRLIAVPGDTLMIDDKTIYINGKQFDTPGEQYFKYRLSTKTDFHLEQLSNFSVYKPVEIVKNMAWEFHSTPETAAEIARLDNVITIRRLQALSDKKAESIFPQSMFISWNDDNYGPLIIPSAGQPIDLNYKNYKLYQRLISVYEGHDFYIRSRKISIDGKNSSRFVPQKDYYFVIDDMRDAGKDSRHIGFLPDNHIIGKKAGQHAE